MEYNVRFFIHLLYGFRTHFSVKIHSVKIHICLKAGNNSHNHFRSLVNSLKFNRKFWS
jgi:hypothetical protein